MRIVSPAGKKRKKFKLFNGLSSSNGWNGHLWKNVAEMARGLRRNLGRENRDIWRDCRNYITYFVQCKKWAGTPLKYILELAQVQPDAIGFNLISADQYSAPISLKAASLAGSFLAYEWEGKALPQLHGFPLRAIFPGSEGAQWVKWLVRIEVY